MYKMRAKVREKRERRAFGALWFPNHVGTLMKKPVHLLV
jgi:hypothetical protein